MIDVLQARIQEPVALSPFHEWVLPDGTPWTFFYRTQDGYLLRFPGLADFVISADGSQAQCAPVDGVSDETVRHLYHNQVLPLAMSKQGKLVFHASAISARGGALAFLGESGRGKSTLAASFARSGHPFLADDGLVVESVLGEPLALPRQPSIRLWSDSQDALIAEGARIAPPVQFSSKSRFPASEEMAFCPEPCRLHQAFFLGVEPVETVEIRPMRPSEALMELVKHSFLLDTKVEGFLAAHFEELAALANRPIFFRLEFPRRYEELPKVQQAILEHVSGDPR